MDDLAAGHGVLLFEDPAANLYRDDERLVGASLARKNFSTVLGKVRHGAQRFLIKEHKEPVAGLVPIGNVKAIDILEKLGVLDQVESLSYASVTLDELLRVLKSSQVTNRGKAEGKNVESGSAVRRKK